MAKRSNTQLGEKRDKISSGTRKETKERVPRFLLLINSTVKDGQITTQPQAALWPPFARKKMKKVQR